MWIYLNNRFVPKHEAVVSVFDHGFLYGDGIYETLRSYGPTIFLLEEHLARLHRSAELIQLALPIDDAAWPQLLEEAMRRNQVGTAEVDAYIRITISRGPGEIGLDPTLCPAPTLVIMTKPLVRPSDTLYRDGVRLITAQTRRNQAESLNPQIKSLNFLNNILAKQEALAAGAYDAVMLNLRGEIAECTISNLFFVMEDRLCTPAIECGLLDGITRNMVLAIAREAGIHTDEGRFSLNVLREASECFVTNTSSEVLPVTWLDGRPVGSGQPGPLTRDLGQRFRQQVQRMLAAPGPRKPARSDS